MKTPTFALLLAFLLPLIGCVPQAYFPALPAAATDEERRILVTFVDHSIQRNVPGNPLDHYRSRGGYASSSWSSRVATDLAERYKLRLVAEWPITVLGVACVVYEVPPGRSMEEVLKALAPDRQIESVQTMRTFKVSGQKEIGAGPYGDPYYRLQKDLQAMHIDAAHRLATGRGVRIAVIDTGMDASHPDLAGQIALSENLALRDAGENTADVHGTAVAGVIAARSENGIGIVGIAPAAELYALRACWPQRPGAAEALCNSFTLALAMNEAIRLDAHIINLSLTGPGDPLVEKLIRTAIDKGIIIVASDSGQAGPTSSFPANLEGVIAVRTASPARESGPIPNAGISAPGSNILTTLPHGTYDFMSGSSFAAPHVTGLLALMRELKPSLTGREALQALRATSAASDSSESPAYQTVDACKVLAQLRGVEDCLLANLR